MAQGQRFLDKNILSRRKSLVNQRGVLLRRRRNGDCFDAGIAKHLAPLAYGHSVALREFRGDGRAGVDNTGQSSQTGKIAHEVSAPVAAAQVGPCEV
jgi:hypothetical protein